MKMASALRTFFNCMLGLSFLAACAGSGAPPGAVGPASGDLSLASPQGPAVQGNAAEKYEGGFPAPLADLESCGLKYCLFDPHAAAQCLSENGTYRILFSGRIVPQGYDLWRNLSDRAIRIVDPALNRFVDVALSGEITTDGSNLIKNKSGSFEVRLNGSFPLKREVYLLPAGEPTKPWGEENPCDSGLCPPPQSELVAWGGSDLTPKIKPSNEVEKSSLTKLNSALSKPEIRNLPSATIPLQHFPDCPTEED